MDMMGIRRAILMNADQLPPGYQEYDYVQTVSAKSYADTGVPGNDDTIQIDCTFQVQSTANWSPIFGSYNGNNQTTCWFLRQGGNPYAINFTSNWGKVSGGSTSIALNVSTIAGVKIAAHMELGKLAITYNGTKDAKTQVIERATPSILNIFIGNFATPQNYYSPTRFYGPFRIWSGGKLVRDYRPAVRLRDSKAGFYDMVNYTFNPSIGTAEFVAGND